MKVISTHLGFILKFDNAQERKKIAQQLLDMPNDNHYYAYYDDRIPEEEMTELLDDLKDGEL